MTSETQRHRALTSIEPSDLLADQAYTQLSMAILRNELAPGASLSVPELARQLGVSRSPVREAVQRLIYDGLADYRGRQGTVVSMIELSNCIALLEVREVLEGLAARLAAQRATDDDRSALRRNHDEFMAVGNRGEPAVPDFVQSDMAFHACIRQMARNDDLSQALARIQARAHLSMHTLWGRQRNVRAAQAEHGEIFEAIVGGNAGRADHAARSHVARLRDRILSNKRGDSADDIA